MTYFFTAIPQIHLKTRPPKFTIKIANFYVTKEIHFKLPYSLVRLLCSTALTYHYFAHKGLLESFLYFCLVDNPCALTTVLLCLLGL